MTHIGSLLLDAATLMATGMTVVFLFLTLLVYLVQLMSRLVPQEVMESAESTKKNQAVTDSISPQVVAAIAAAVHQYRNAVVKS